MKIIDAHMHLGEDLLFNSDDSEETLLRTMDEHGISAQVVQPGIVARDQVKAHERIRRFADRNPGRCYGVAVFNPLMEEAEYGRLVRWAVKDLGFLGIKLHTNAFCMAPGHPAARKIYSVAEELDIVVMVHTGNGLPNALPSLLIPVAREHPKLRIVVAHAGGGTFGADAIVAAETCPNLYLETSWVTSYDLAAMVKRLGEQRVMFGTDLVNNVAVELAKYRSAGLSERQLEWCLGKTAASVFKIPA